MSFYNTTKLKGEELNQAIKAAKTQDDKVLIIFKERKGQLLNPFHVHMVYCNILKIDVPITSIRRSITSLTKQNLLLKSESATSKGKYGKCNHVWTLAA